MASHTAVQESALNQSGRGGLRRSASPNSESALPCPPGAFTEESYTSDETLDLASATTVVPQSSAHKLVPASTGTTADISEPSTRSQTSDGPAAQQYPVEEPTRDHEQFKQQREWWWWWEIAAALLSVLSMSLVLAILLAVNGRPLTAWRLPIQPNSLIAVFTTIAKTSMMVPVASGLSQLKWRHFHLRPERLDHISGFDEASRGPWGSLLLLVNVRTTALLAWSFAVVTLAALGIEPMAQQILGFPTKEVFDGAQVVNIGTTTSYTSKAQMSTSAFNSGNFSRWTSDDGNLSRLTREHVAGKVAFKAAMTSAILGMETQPPFVCPEGATNCIFPSFTTLGVCGTIENRTSQIDHTCATNNLSETICAFSGPDEFLANMAFNYTVDPSIKEVRLFQNDVFKMSGDHWDMAYGRGLQTDALRVWVAPASSGRGYTLLRAELLRMSWQWCAQTYNSTTASPTGVSSGLVTTETLEIVNPNAYPTETYVAKSTGQLYTVDSDSSASLWSDLDDVLSCNIIRFTLSQQPSAGTPFGNGDITVYLYETDLAVVMANIAATLSNMVRSTADNRDATFTTGEGYVRETYFEVGWGWLILPLAESFLVAGLLVSTIMVTRKSGQPLLKSSPLGLLFHGLEGWTPGETHNRTGGQASASALEGIAKGMTVRFTKDDQERLRFVRV